MERYIFIEGISQKKIDIIESIEWKNLIEKELSKQKLREFHTQNAPIIEWNKN